MTLDDVFVLPFNQTIVDKTVSNTIRKYKFTISSLMYNRTPVELLDNIFMGDLAKNAVFYYLQHALKKPVSDYDELRTDDFTEADPGWDFLVGEKRRLKAEVKSSIPPDGETAANIIEKRDIKITASHDKGQTWIMPADLESDLHLQVYFYAKPYKRGYSDPHALYRMISNNPEEVKRILHVEKYAKPLFFGWSSKKKIKQLWHELHPGNTWSFSWTSRIYWRCPIKQAWNMPYLVKTIEQYL